MASEPAHNWPVNRYLYVRQGKADGGTISVQHARPCTRARVCVFVCVYFYYGLKLRHLLPGTSIPSVEMGFKQTDKLKNELVRLQEH